jgi:hypothetical protein
VRDDYNQAFKLTIGLEGKPSNDPRDPGGFTIWGLSARWNKVTIHTTIDEAKAIYLRDYWIPAGCDTQPFPMDICLFDSQVNPQNDPKLPGGGNQEIMNMAPVNWQEYTIFRMQRYMRVSKDVYVKGHIFRVLRLCDSIRLLEIERGTRT